MVCIVNHPISIIVQQSCFNTVVIIFHNDSFLWSVLNKKAIEQFTTKRDFSTVALAAYSASWYMQGFIFYISFMVHKALRVTVFLCPSLFGSRGQEPSLIGSVRRERSKKHSVLV